MRSTPRVTKAGTLTVCILLATACANDDTDPFRAVQRAVASARTCYFLEYPLAHSPPSAASVPTWLVLTGDPSASDPRPHDAAIVEDTTPYLASWHRTAADSLELTWSARGDTVGARGVLRYDSASVTGTVFQTHGDRSWGVEGVRAACPSSLAATRNVAAGRRRYVVIDTDAGPDDLMAIAFLLGRQDVKIGAIVVVTGLTTVGPGARNILRLLHLAGADHIPVYVGAVKHIQPTTPFPKAWVDAAEKAGASAAPPAGRPPEQGSGIDALVSILTNPEWRDLHMELLAIGPLTNIALAIRKAGRDRVQPIRTVVMGGAVDVPGNLVTTGRKSDNTKAEWNIFSDPEAAREVFESPLRIEMIPLDATNQVQIDSCFVQALKSGPDTPTRGYVGRILDFSRDEVDRGQYYAWDPLAAVALVDSGVVRPAAATLVVDVEYPFPGWTHRSPAGRDILAALNADRQRFMRTFDAALGPRHGAPIATCN